MNSEIANAMYGYLETLYYLNQKIIKMCGTEAIGKYEYNHKAILDIIQDIPRMIPYLKDKNTGKYILTNRDGLLEYSNELPFLNDEYQKILDNNLEFLIKVKKIRNNYEHKMQGIKHKSSGSGSVCLFDFTFEIKENDEYKEIHIKSFEFIKLIKQLNILFSIIVKEISKFAYEEKLLDNDYYRKICNFDFEKLNKLYDSELLRTIGKIMIGY